MIVTTSGPGPTAADSCATAWLAPSVLAAAMRTAMKRFMCVTSCCCLAVGPRNYRLRCVLFQSGRRLTARCVVRAICVHGEWTSAICDFWTMPARLDLPDNLRQQDHAMTDKNAECAELWPPPPSEVDANDPEVLRAALIREASRRARAE